LRPSPQPRNAVQRTTAHAHEWAKVLCQPEKKKPPERRLVQNGKLCSLPKFSEGLNAGFVQKKTW
jgi:hypothetical protein